MMIRAPGRIDKNTLKETGRFAPSALSLSEQLNSISTASMEVPADDPVTVGDWVSLYTVQGMAGIFRVQATDERLAPGHTKTLTLQHLSGLLQDTLINGEMTTRQISGRDVATVTEALTAILDKQTAWAVGTIGYDDEFAYTFSDMTLADAVDVVTGALTDALITYDMSEYPFRLNITRKAENASCEMRLSRNMESVTRTLDTSEMYTRIYPLGFNNLRVDGDYLERNTDRFGVIEHTESDYDIEDAAQLAAWAEAMLAIHAEPQLSVTISGDDLSASTGEAIDRLAVGTRCRVPLPEFGTTIDEIIVSADWPDLVRAPTAVNISISNGHRDVATIIHKLKKEAKKGGGGRGGGKSDEKQEEKDTRYEYQFSVTEQGLAFLNSFRDGQLAQNIEFIARFDGLTATLNEYRGDQEADHATLVLTASGLAAEITRATASEDTLSASIDAQADKIALVVEENDDHENVVNAASIVLGINGQTGSYVKINAATVELGDYATVGSLSATNATIANLRSGELGFSRLVGTRGDFNSIYLGGNQLTRITRTIDGVSTNLISYY